MPVKFTSNVRSIKQDFAQKGNIFLREVTDQIDRVSTPNTPKKTGDLRNRKLKQVLGLSAAIKWMTNYAVFQEKKQFSNYTTPGTGPNFAENAVRGVVGKTQQIILRIFR